MRRRDVLVGAAGVLAAAPALAGSKWREQRIAGADGVNLRVVRLGQPSRRPPIVLVSGWLVGLEVYATAAALLARSGEVVLFDSRSQGGSDRSLSRNRPEDRAGDIAAILTGLGLKRPLVVGWSQGAQDVAALSAAGQSMAGTVLVDALPSGGPGDALRSAAVFERLNLFRRVPDAYLEGMLSMIISRPDADALRRQLADIGRRTPVSLAVDMLCADLFGVDRSGVEFKAPLMVLAASTNPDHAAMASWTASKGGSFDVAPDAAHAVFVDQPDYFARTVGAFADQLPGPAGG